MVTSFDEKGKIFTQVVRKQPTQVTIQTLDYQIRGQVHVHPDSRLKDEIEREEHFVALTDVTIHDKSGALVMRTAFIAVNKAQIIWIVPDEDIAKEKQE